MKKNFSANVFQWVGSLLLLAGCDWNHYALINSVPFEGKETQAVNHVFIGVDGLAHETVLEAQRLGYFSSQWRVGQMVSMFPATSDSSWTRILHTKPIESYEYTYYHPGSDRIENKGYLGLIKHIIPTFMDGLSLEADYFKAFDYRANGYSHTIGVYHDTWANYAESLDNLFFILSGRIHTQDTFSGYLMEVDAMGHILPQKDALEALQLLLARIEKFRAQHPKNRFQFTLFSDHGMDFKGVPPQNLITLSSEMRKVGVQPVESLQGWDRSQGLVAVPIDHIRATYLSVNAPREQVEEVSQRLSQIDSVDVVVAKLTSQEQGGNLLRSQSTPWYGVWASGKLALSFGFDPQTNQYLIPRQSDFKRFGLDLTFAERENLKSLSDVDLFEKMKRSPYPDLFYRVRSGLEPVGIQFPADILVSFKSGYVALGFTLPGGDKNFSLAGFHGSLLDKGSAGVVITEGREIPESIRSDNFLEFFPEMRRNMEEKGVKIYSGEPNALLPYPELKIR